MLSVQSYNFAPKSNLYFKSNETKPDTDKTKPEAFQTHAGLKTGAVYAGIEGIVGLAACLGMKQVKNNVLKEALIDELDAHGKEIPEYFGEEHKEIQNVLKNVNKSIAICLPLAILLSLGSGFLVDKLINDKQAKFADKFSSTNKKDILKEEDHAELTRKDNVYYKSNIGKMVGPALGAVILPVIGVITSSINKVKLPAVAYVGEIAGGALGGLILGAITDKIANKGAAKHADKQNVQNN